MTDPYKSTGKGEKSLYGGKHEIGGGAGDISFETEAAARLNTAPAIRPGCTRLPLLTLRHLRRAAQTHQRHQTE